MLKRVPRHALPVRSILTAAALLLGVTSALQGSAVVKVPVGSDQFAFFMPAAQHILDGHPGAAYEVTFQGYPVVMPPLTLLFEALGMLVGEKFLPGARACAAGGFLVPSCTTLLWWLNLLSVPVVIASAFLVDRIVGAGRRGLVGFALMCISPLVWLNTTIWGHLEEPLMLAFLTAGVWLQQRRRPWCAGAALGLAVMTRATAVAPVLALLILIVFQRDYRSLAKVIAASASISAVAFAPFLMTNPGATLHALLGFHGTAPVRNSVWSLFRGTPLGSAVQHLDTLTMLLCTCAVAVWAALRLRVRSDHDDAWAVIALAALMLPLLAKTIWPYYFVEPVAALLIWELRTGGRQIRDLWRWPTISVLYVLVATSLHQFMGPAALNGFALRLAGVTNFVFVAAIAASIVIRLRQGRMTAQQDASTGQPDHLAMATHPAKSSSTHPAVPDCRP